MMLTYFLDQLLYGLLAIDVFVGETAHKWGLFDAFEG